MKDSQRGFRKALAGAKYIKESNERFSTRKRDIKNPW